MQDCEDFSQWREWLEFLLRLIVFLIELWKDLSSPEKRKKEIENKHICLSDN